MTVEELAALLKDMPQEDLVMVRTKDGEAAVTDVHSGSDVLIGDGAIQGITYLQTVPCQEGKGAQMGEKWNKTGNPRPYELVEILVENGKVHRDMMVRAKYGSLTWRNWDDRSVAGWRALR